MRTGEDRFEIGDNLATGAADTSGSENDKSRKFLRLRHFLARTTGLEPATTGSTVRYSNQLSYVPKHSNSTRPFPARQAHETFPRTPRTGPRHRGYCVVKAKKGSGPVGRSTLRTVPATGPDPFFALTTHSPGRRRRHAPGGTDIPEGTATPGRALFLVGTGSGELGCVAACQGVPYWGSPGRCHPAPSG